MYYPVGQKFAQNRSISPFPRYFQCFFFRLNPRWTPKVGKTEIFPLNMGYSCTTLWPKNSLKITLSLTFFEIFTLFHFSTKIQDGRKKWRKLKFFPFA